MKSHRIIMNQDHVWFATSWKPFNIPSQPMALLCVFWNSLDCSDQQISSRERHLLSLSRWFHPCLLASSSLKPPHGNIVVSRSHFIRVQSPTTKMIHHFVCFSQTPIFLYHLGGVSFDSFPKQLTPNVYHLVFRLYHFEKPTVPTSKVSKNEAPAAHFKHMQRHIPGLPKHHFPFRFLAFRSLTDHLDFQGC